jgi:hypothetical protein
MFQRVRHQIEVGIGPGDRDDIERSDVDGIFLGWRERFAESYVLEPRLVLDFPKMVPLRLIQHIGIDVADRRARFARIDLQYERDGEVDSLGFLGW